MLPELLQKSKLFSILYQIDLDLAQKCRENGCPFCGGALHQANYSRQPWGAPKDIADEQMIRQSLCCARQGCRKRTLPPSCLYFGRKKYWSAVILVVMALRQNKHQRAICIKLMRLFAISYKTILRWRDWFRDIFPTTRQWIRLRGRVSASIDSSLLPAGLLDYFLHTHESAEAALVGCLAFLASP